jgi:hypothetical protein
VRRISSLEALIVLTLQFSPTIFVKGGAAQASPQASPITQLLIHNDGFPDLILNPGDGTFSANGADFGSAQQRLSFSVKLLVVHSHVDVPNAGDPCQSDEECVITECGGGFSEGSSRKSQCCRRGYSERRALSHRVSMPVVGPSWVPRSSAADFPPLGRSERRLPCRWLSISHR